MRVPVIEGPTVAPVGMPDAQPALARDNPTVGNAIAQSGQALGGWVDRGMANVERAAAAADAIKQTQSLADLEGTFQRYIGGDSSPQGQQELQGLGLPGTGFKGVQGLQETGAASQRTQAAMERALEKAASSFTDPRQQEEFRAKATHLFNAYHQDLERHFSAQLEKDKLATGQGSVAQLVSGALSGKFDPKTVALSRDVVMQQLRSLGWEPAKVQAVGESIAGAVVEGLIARQKFAEAQDYLEAEADQVGSLYPKLKAELDTRLGVSFKDQQKAQVTGQVAKWADAIRSQDGLVTQQEWQSRSESAMEAAGIKPGTPLFDEFQKQVEAQGIAEQKKLHAYAGQARDEAFEVYVNGPMGPNGKRLPPQQMPSKQERILSQYWPEAIDYLERARRAKFREARGMNADARREQTMVDNLWKATAAEALTNDPNTNLEDLRQQFVTGLKVQDVVPSDLAVQQTRTEQAKGVKRQGSAYEAAKQRWGEKVYGEFLRALPKKGNKPDIEGAHQQAGWALTQYEDKFGGQGDKPPDYDEADRLKTQMVTKGIVPGSGFMGMFQKKKFGAELAHDAATTPPVEPAPSDQPEPVAAPAAAPTSAAPQSPPALHLVGPNGKPAVKPKPSKRPIVKNPKTGERRYLNPDNSLGEVVQ